MNSIETTPRFEKQFDQDRVEKEPVSSPPRPLNALRTTKSAPVSSMPRESLLVRSPTSLLTSTVDHGLMDMSVDDGTNGNIDDTVRLLRFSTAASAIDGIFHSPRRNTQESNPFKTEKPTCVSPAPANHTDLSPQASGKMPVSLGTPETTAEKSVHMDGNSQGPKKVREATEDVSSAREETPSKNKKQPQILETEPVTPPRAEGNKLVEETDPSETPSRAKEASSEHTTSGSLGKYHDSENKVAPTDSAQNEDPAHESVPPIRRRLSALFSTNDEASHVGAAPQSEIQQGLRGSKRESKIHLVKLFKRSSARAVKTPPQPAIEQNEPATNKGPRKLKMLVKKLSSGFRERAGGERKAAIRPSGKAPTPTVTAATVPPADNVHAGTLDSCERPTRSDLLAVQPASSGGSRNAILEQPTQSASGEQAQFTKGDRQLLQRLLKGFSSGSKDRTSESKGEGHAEVRQEAPNKGAFFAKLFRRKSTNAEEKESETGNTPCPEEGGTSDTPAFSAPPESQTRWSQLSQKVTRFLGMLVH